MSEEALKDTRTNLERAQDQFILEWGRMSDSWGINRTMAQIHALLFVSGQPLDMNEIMDRLHISRGNASMNLHELMDWGIVRRFRRPGDRKDTYISDTDPFQVFMRVARERKRRELDPTADVIEEVLRKLPESDQTEGARTLRKRLQDLLAIFELIDLVFQQAFTADMSLDELRSALERTSCG